MASNSTAPDARPSDWQPVDAHVIDLYLEHFVRRDVLGIGTAAPRVSWISETGATNWQQSAYALELLDENGQTIATTGRVESRDSVLVAWPFEPLRSRQRRGLRVVVWGSYGSEARWSRTRWVEAGLLESHDWSARFISPDWDEDLTRPQPAPLLRREFTLRKEVAQARLYITALGVYQAEINGQRVGDEEMAPGWTSYNHRLRYQTHDVTPLLKQGANAIGATVADGWYRGRLGYHGGRRNIYGERLALLAQLEVTYTDGTIETVVTDDTWRAATGALLASDIYDGEIYDARLERTGWSNAEYDADDWQGVRILERGVHTLVAPTAPPVRITQEIAPVAILTSPAGKILVDFGQNLVGRVRIRVRGDAGQTIVLRHAEVLENGELGTRPLRYAAATDQYTLRGGEEEVWEPRFTFHGFRFVQVDGWQGTPSVADLTAIVIHSDLAWSGWFECSDPLINQLHENVRWSMRGNFLDIPTDCPQRDERLGWTGDIQVFAPTGASLYDVAGFLESWLADLAAEQRDNGGIVPFFVPNIMDAPPAPAAAWGDAACVVPWVLWERYGDRDLLAKQFESMRSWVDVVVAAAGPTRLWERGIQFGDWLDPAAPPDNPGGARTSQAIVATAYLARSADLTARAATVLGYEAEATYYGALADETRAAFAHAYVTPGGRLMSDATTAYALALEFSLLPTAEQRKNAGARLLELVRSSGYHISTGFVGTPLVCDALCDAGYVDAAYRLLLQKTTPSWLYPVTMGATTIWERWDSMLPDGSINPGEMTSFNHYALGAVADWLHRRVAGLAPAEPGYRRLKIAPLPPVAITSGGLTHASAIHLTPYGSAEAGWKIADGTITVEITVPGNVTAEVHLPGKDEVIEVGSGIYRWSYPWNPPAPILAPLTLDSPLGDALDDPKIYEAILRVMAEHNLEFAKRWEGQTSVSLREAALQNPDSGTLLARFEAALAREK